MTPSKMNTPVAALLTLVAFAPLVQAASPSPGETGPASDEQVVKQRLKVVVEDEDGEDPKVFVVGDHVNPLILGLGQRTYLGIGMIDITPELREHFGVDGESGVLISEIGADSPAAEAGLRAGDVLTAIDGEPMARSGQVIRDIGRREDNETVSLEVWRDGKMMNVGATLETRERTHADLGRMLRRVAPLPEIPKVPPIPPIDLDQLNHRVIEIETAKIDEALSRVRERLDSPEWKARLEEMASRRHGLEERIHELEERLREMEKRLSEADG